MVYRCQKAYLRWQLERLRVRRRVLFQLPLQTLFGKKYVCTGTRASLFVWEPTGVGCRSGRGARWRTFSGTQPIYLRARCAPINTNKYQDIAEDSRKLDGLSCRSFHPSNNRGEFSVLPSSDLYDAIGKHSYLHCLNASPTHEDFLYFL
jgi:hypothetical protein